MLTPDYWFVNRKWCDGYKSKKKISNQMLYLNKIIKYG
jgi:hypothetical protein